MSATIHKFPLHALEGRLAKDQRTGQAYPHVANVLVVLAHDPMLAGMVGYNEFEEEPQIRRAPPAINPGDMDAAGPYPRAFRHADVVAITAYIQRAYLARAGQQIVEDGLRTDAERHRFHPVREWLDSLQWDGTRRIDTWICKAFGAPDTDYTRAVSAKILLASVRRVRRPGFKFDEMPVFEGLQGAGKSRTVRRLYGDDWFTDSMPADLTSKDGAQAVLGIWCVEFAEIEHLIRTDPETLKAFLSRPVERFRPPYARAFMKRGRECVFIGTTNASDYLRDTTGNRRIWPIACEWADEDWVKENRDQLWAEASMREASGEILWLEEDAKAEATEMQAERLMEDVWSEKIRAYLKDQRSSFAAHVTIPGVLSMGLGIDAARMDKRAEMRAATVLAREGLIKSTIRENTKTRKIWKWPE